VPTVPPAEHLLVVAASEAGSRLDAFLACRELMPSAAAARRAVASGTVRVNGRVGKKGLRLVAGDQVDLGEGPAAEPALAPAPAPELELDVLYQDGDIVAVNKPAGVHTHPLRPGEGATLAGALVAKFPECRDASPDAREGGLGHRLDGGTSGVLLAARSREVWYRLREALANPHCEKTYLAEVQGAFPAGDGPSPDYVVPGPRPSSFAISAPIGRHGRHAGRVEIASGRQPLPAQTLVTLLASQPPATLVEARLARGRAHQVRAHLAYLGIPVTGDPIYGQAGAEGSLHLHAWAVSLLHPVTGQPLRVEAPPPAWVQAYSNWAMLVSTSRNSVR
jgi:23S rRNA pseudouridine1911/1915/1917 synthase